MSFVNSNALYRRKYAKYNGLKEGKGRNQRKEDSCIKSSFTCKRF